MRKKIIYIALFSLLILIILSVFYILNIKEKNKPFLDYQKGSGVFSSFDNNITFKYPDNVQYKSTGDKTTFYIIQDCHGDMGQCGVFGFEFMENRKGDINELYKENIFYKEDSKNFYGEKEIVASGRPAYQYSFCDSANCSEENMMHEIFISYDNKIYSFFFGGFGGSIEQEVLNSIKYK